MTKHDNKTADKEILDNAPEGATHVDNNGFYLKASTSGYMDIDEDGRDWDYDYANHCHTRSLDDIRRIKELEQYLENVKTLSVYVAFHDSANDVTMKQARDWLAIRDLEQQAKGIELALKFEKEQSNRMAFGGVSEFVLSKYATQLRKQANRLKGGDL